MEGGTCLLRAWNGRESSVDEDAITLGSRIGSRSKKQPSEEHSSGGTSHASTSPSDERGESREVVRGRVPMGKWKRYQVCFSPSDRGRGVMTCFTHHIHLFPHLSLFFIPTQTRSALSLALLTTIESDITTRANHDETGP